MPNLLWPADNLSATIRTIPCPDCTDGFDLGSLRQPEACGTCAGYGRILAPEEVELTKADQQRMHEQGAYDLKRRLMGRAANADLKPQPEYIEGTGGRFAS